MSLTLRVSALVLFLAVLVWKPANIDASGQCDLSECDFYGGPLVAVQCYFPQACWLYGDDCFDGSGCTYLDDCFDSEGGCAFTIQCG